MAIFIPDLFGSYVDGREKAIDSNWKDMQNYNGVLGGQIDNARDMATFDSKVMQEKGKGLSDYSKGVTDWTAGQSQELLNRLLFSGMEQNDAQFGKRLANAKLGNLLAGFEAGTSMLGDQADLTHDNTETQKAVNTGTRYYANGPMLGDIDARSSILRGQSTLVGQQAEFAKKYPFLYWAMNGMLPGSTTSQSTVSGNGNNGNTSVDAAKQAMDAEQGNADANKDENSDQGN